VAHPQGPEAGDDGSPWSNAGSDAVPDPAEDAGVQAPHVSDTDGPDHPDDPDAEGSGTEEHEPLRFQRWMRSSATGGVLTGIALGLQHALEQRREQPAFVMEAPGEPEDPDAPITLHFDPDDPTKTVAVVRTPPPGPTPPPMDAPHPQDPAGPDDT